MKQKLLLQAHEIFLYLPGYLPGNPEVTFITVPENQLLARLKHTPCARAHVVCLNRAWLCDPLACVKHTRVPFVSTCTHAQSFHEQRSLPTPYRPAVPDLDNQRMNCQLRECLECRGCLIFPDLTQSLTIRASPDPPYHNKGRLSHRGHYSHTVYAIAKTWKQVEYPSKTEARSPEPPCGPEAGCGQKPYTTLHQTSCPYSHPSS